MILSNPERNSLLECQVRKAFFVLQTQTLTYTHTPTHTHKYLMCLMDAALLRVQRKAE